MKICCIGSPEEAATAVRHGADALGLVAAMPSGPGPIADALIRDIARAVPPPVATFLLTSRTRADDVVRHVLETRVSTVQLVDEVEPDVYPALREHAPGVRIVQVIHVRSDGDVRAATAVAPRVDALLLDSGRPDAAVRELGGTGRTHDWAVSRRIVDAVGVPVFLAGGLNAENVGRAIEAVRPYGVDVCSGVRTGGRLDPAKLDAFARAIR